MIVYGSLNFHKNVYALSEIKINIQLNCVIGIKGKSAKNQNYATSLKLNKHTEES